MNDSLATSAQGPDGQPESRGRWLLLIHQIPPKPDYFRVKVRRRLQRIGAVALKNSVYVLPRSDSTLEDFEWLGREIAEDGGEATLWEGEVAGGMSDGELRELFRAEREADYREVADAARVAARNDRDELEATTARLERRLAEIVATDFFDSSGRAAAEAAVAALRARAAAPGRAASAAGRASPIRGATWVTRQGVFVDRIASAWLIRRFIDPDARFKFVAARGYRPATGEVCFDMYQGQFTHEGERCTFETLLDRFGLNDPALRAVGEIVHDIDCKDERYGRPEVAGLASILEGIALTHQRDADRVEHGAGVFDGLYARMRGNER
jgi:hypothetical protein